MDKYKLFVAGAMFAMLNACATARAPMDVAVPEKSGAPLTLEQDLANVAKMENVIVPKCTQKKTDEYTTVFDCTQK